MKRRYEGTICVFLALIIFLIISLVLIFLESARRSASQSYATMLLKTANDSVMGDYNGPLFAEYNIFALDSGFGSKTGDTDELERKLKRYMGENVWGFENTDLKVTEVSKLMDSSGEKFIEQATAYEKYAAVGDVVEEIIGRVKNLSDQGTITKIMEKKLGIEDELSVIDKYTLDLMKYIDGVNLSFGAKTSSLLGYSVADSFIKKFFIGQNDMSGVMINNPSVYERLKDKYINPIPKVNEYSKKLKEHKKKLVETQEELDKLKKAEEIETALKESLELKTKEFEDIGNEEKELENLISEYKSKLEEAHKIKDKNERKAEEEKYSQLLDDAIKRLEEVRTLKTAMQTELEMLTQSTSEAIATADALRTKTEGDRLILDEQYCEITELATELDQLHSYTVHLLEQVCQTVDNVAKKQAKIRPMVEEFEELMKVLGPVLSDEIKDTLTDSLDYMRAYVGMAQGKIKTTDFDSINRTAEADLSLLRRVDATAFEVMINDNVENTTDRLSKAENIADIYAGFSYAGFSFDYSEIKESFLENKLVEEFENNVSDGYLQLFLKPDIKLSDNSLISEVLPSKWFQVLENEEEDLEGLAEDAGDKGSGEMLSDADESTGISDLADIIGDGAAALGEKFLSAMYMQHHFKSFSDKSVTGDTVLDYEVEYILSGFMTDKANLSAAATKIMLLRLIVCTIYTMTNKNTKLQAQTLATSIMGFTGLPFLITIVKYLILFLWAAAQAVIETAAIMRGKKVPVIPNDKSFCLTLAELPLFATLISEKADNMAESEVYLDYDNYLMVLLLLQGSKTQAARAMDVIQENIRYKYDEDFLMCNALTGFSSTAEFFAPVKYSSLLSGLPDNGSVYSVKVEDKVSY